MDTTSQDSGMLRAYGLVYNLLSHGVPVRWAIAPGKAQNAADFSALALDLETGTSLGAVTYAGGPFFVAADDREAALPLINAWLASDCETVVHEAVAPFTAEETRVLTAAPRLAIARDRYQSIAFGNFNAAGIPDSTGAAWSLSSPDLLTESQLVGSTTLSARDGALWNSDGTPAYCHLTFSYYWPTSRTPSVVAELREWLGTGVFTQVFAQAESLRTIENDSQGHFLTTAGIVDDGYTPYVTSNWAPSDPLSQFAGVFYGSPDGMDSIGLAPGSVFYDATRRLIGHSSVANASGRLLLLSGPLDGNPAQGRATYLAGFDYGVDLPISTHPWTNGVRILLNSVLASECNLQENQPAVQLSHGSQATVTGPEVTFAFDYGNDGPAPAADAVLEASIPAGATFVSASDGGVFGAGTVTWSLANLAVGSSGQITLTIVAATPGAYATTATLHYRVGVTPKRVSDSQAAVIADVEPPATLFSAVPPNPTELTTAMFALASNRAPVTYECSLDGQAYAPCTATLTLTGLAPGDHSFQARAIDERGNVDPTPASYAWHIAATPVAHDDAVTVAEDATETLLEVLANDEPGDAPTVIQAVSSAAHGAVRLVGQQLGYTPEPDYHGVDAFSYTIADGDGQTSTATVAIVVLSVDDVPAASDDAATVDEDGEVTVPVLANDAGLGDAPIAISQVSAPFHGDVSIIGAALRYTPTADYHGPELITYVVTDGDGQTATATVVISVAPVNDVPAAVDDAAVTAEDAGGIELDVLANDVVADAPGRVVGVTSPAHGTAALTAGGAIRYVPAPDYAGLDALSYTVADLDGELATATVVVTVTPVDDVPVAVADLATTDEDVEVTVAVLGNDEGLGDAPVRIVAVSAPARGTVAVVGEQVRYVPAPDRHGLDTFTYTIQDGDGQLATALVTVTVVAVDDVPVAVDDAVVVDEDSVGNAFAVLANDRVGDAPGAISAITAPAHGVAAVVGDLVVYTPEADFFGSDAVTYTVTDADGQTAEATVTITVTSVNDTPVAVDDAADVLGNTTVLVPVLANDLDLGDDPVELTSVGTPASGSALIEGRAIRYTPNRYFTGVVTFPYTVRDLDGEASTATVSIAVTSVNLTPVANDDVATVAEDGSVLISVRDNDTGGDAPVVSSATSTPLHGSASLIGEQLQYVPAADYFGADSFTYTIVDEDGETSTATVVVTVTPVNDTPAAQVDSFKVLEDSGPTLLSVLANDAGLGDAPITFVSFSDPPHGTVVVVGTQLQYTPDPDYNGSDAFTYRIRDLDNQQSSSTVFVTVTNVNDAPTANADAFVVTAGVATSLNVLANDRDIDGNPLTLESVSAPTVGSATISANQAVYTAPAGYVGVATFSYVVNDGRGGTGTALVAVTVQ